MLERVLEPEWMDTAEEAETYDAMDHAAVNAAFVDTVADRLHTGERPRTILDLGCGTALIPLLLSRRVPEQEILAVDAAGEMLRVASDHLSGIAQRPAIRLLQADCKRLPLPDGSVDAVISNSLLHHIPEPIDVLREIARVTRDDAAIVLRDLRRPPTQSALERLVDRYTQGEPPIARKLFAESLHAALTPLELAERLRAAGLHRCTVEETSDRHVTAATPCVPPS